MNIHDLPTPALLLDVDVLERNLQRMQDRARRFGVALRPHIKTHKCLEIGRRQLELGAAGITVSTLAEARTFADAGFSDITWAFPIPPVHIPEALRLARRVIFRVVVDDLETAGALEEACRAAGQTLRVCLKVDCGYHRAGVQPGSAYALELAHALGTSRTLRFDGILSHSGHAYQASSREEILEIAEAERAIMVDFAERLRGDGIDVSRISIGSTPTLSVADRLTGITEIRPGNYAFYDATQVALGSCSVEDCALTVLASVVSHQPGAAHFVTDAGALALSKDPGPTHLPGAAGLGRIFDDYAAHRLRDDLRLEALSQEHGKVVTHAGGIDGRFRVGERVRILEQHSCLTAALFDAYQVVRGDTVIDTWPIRRQRA